MSAVTVLKVEQEWAGDRRRHRVIFTSASATTDTVTPNAVGLQFIEAVVPTGRSGTIDGNTVVAAGAVDIAYGAGGAATQVIIVYIPTSTSAVSSGNYEVYFYGK